MASSATRRSRSAHIVQPGTRLAAIVPLASVHVDANFKETQLAAVKPGQKVHLRVDAFPDRDIARRGRERRARLRLGVQPAAARERDRQFHQDRPARARAHRRQTPTWRSRICCGPACRWSSMSNAHVLPTRFRGPHSAETEVRKAMAGSAAITGTPASSRPHDRPRRSGAAPSRSSAWCSACSWRSWTSRSSPRRSPKSRPDSRRRPTRSPGCRRAT